MTKAIDYGVDPKYLIPDEAWAVMEQCLPPPKPKKKAGRPPMDNRQAVTAIFYVLRTGVQWNALPRSLGASSTVHDRFQLWVADGYFTRLWEQGLMAFDELVGLEFEWQALDGAMTKAPLGGKRRGRTGAEPNRAGQARHEA